jgi:hypothetical protein
VKRTLVVHIRRGSDANGRSRYLCERRGPRAELERRHVEAAELERDSRPLERVTCPHCREAFTFSPHAAIGEGPDPWKLRAQGDGT